MQIQMETCGLDECDFLETQICEYKEGEDEFWADTRELEYRGVVLYFVERVSIGGSNGASQDGLSLHNPVQHFDIGAFSGVATNGPHYEYMPLDVPLTREAVEEWIGSTRQRLRRNWSLYTTLWWYMADYSCVLVERNRMWFESARPMIEETWAVILKERDSGYEHRSAKKRSNGKEGGSIKNGLLVVKEGSVVVDNPYRPNNGSVCLVKLE
jgi:hypothetical protein